MGDRVEGVVAKVGSDVQHKLPVAICLHTLPLQHLEPGLRRPCIRSIGPLYQALSCSLVPHVNLHIVDMSGHDLDMAIKVFLCFLCVYLVYHYEC